MVWRVKGWEVTINRAKNDRQSQTFTKIGKTWTQIESEKNRQILKFKEREIYLKQRYELIKTLCVSKGETNKNKKDRNAKIVHKRNWNRK
jgi:hypothetical protein